MRSPTDMRKWCPHDGHMRRPRSSWRLKTWASQLGHFVHASDGAARRLNGNLIGTCSSRLAPENPVAGSRSARAAPHRIRGHPDAHGRTDRTGHDEAAGMTQDPWRSTGAGQP